MMKKFLTSLILLACCDAAVAATQQGGYAFITDSDIRQFETVIDGFRESAPTARIGKLNLDGKADAAIIKKFIADFNPTVIITLGSLAATTVASIETTRPVIFAMVLNYRRYPQLNKPNIAGISMEIPAESLLTQFRLLCPTLHGIAVPYSPAASVEIVRDAKRAAERMKIRILEIAVSDPETLKDKLRTGKTADYHGLWMIADFKLYNKDTEAFAHLLDFSQDNKKPLLGASEAFVKAGAFFSVSVNYHSLGSQLALISRQILDDKIPPGKIGVTPPIGTYTVINKKSGREILGDKFNEELLIYADKIYPED
jgi:putative tryptophan/tyrosine transport system substrate-binding protein